MIFLKEDKYLEKLEKQEKWEEVIKYLYEIWKNDKNDVNAILRIGTECWNILEMWDCCIDTKGLNREDFQSVLIEVTEYGLIKFIYDIKFLCIFGYMMSVLPYLFYTEASEKLFLEWEERGKNMLKKAYDMDQKNLVVKMFILEFNMFQEGTKEYIEIKAEMKNKVKEFFPGNTQIEEYFKEICLCNPYENNANIETDEELQGY